MRLNRRSAGLSIIEVIVAATVLALGVSLALSLFVGVDQTVGESLANQSASERAARVKAALDLELRSAGAYGVNGAFSQVQYRRVIGYDFTTGNSAFGPQRLIRFVLEDNETDDGIDNDNDGLIDEGYLEIRADRNNDDDADDANEVLSTTGGGPSAGYISDNFMVTFPSGAQVPDTTDTQLNVRFSILGLRPELKSGRAQNFNLDRELRIFIRNRQNP